MKRLAIYGVLTGLALAGWTSLEYLLGFHGSATGRYTGFMAFFIFFFGLLQGIRAYRNKEKQGLISYWEAVFAGAVITLLAGLLQAAFTYVYTLYINPGLIDYIIEQQRQALTARGATVAQIAEQARKTRETYQALPLALRSLGGYLATGMIFSLIMSAVLKKYLRD